jgi:hypothetical protein
VLALAVLSACGDGSEASGPEPGGVTGVAEFDRLIRLVDDGDIDGLVASVNLTDLACVTEVEGLGGPPECLDGEAEGTLVAVMPFAACEGTYIRSDGLAPMFESMLVKPQLHSAFALKQRGTSDFPIGDYGLVFTVEDAVDIGATGLMLGISADGEIVSVWRGCAYTAAELFEIHAGAEVLVEPPA